MLSRLPLVHLHHFSVVDLGGTSMAPVLVRDRLSLTRKEKLLCKICLYSYLEQGGTPLVKDRAGHFFFFFFPLSLLQMRANNSSLTYLNCFLLKHNIALQLEPFCRKQGKWVEVAYVLPFFSLWVMPDLCPQFSSFQPLSHVRLFVTPWIAACQAFLSITNSQSSLKLTSIKSVMPFSHLILCCPVLLLAPVPPSIRVFSSESTLCMRWQKYWSFSFSIIPSKEHPGLISFRMDWLDLLAVQGTLKSLLQHHSSKASIFQRLAVFTV